jgi:hypothetical protein
VPEPYRESAATWRESTMTQPEELDLETPEDDAAEQAVDADPIDDEESGYDDGTVDDIEAPEWDVFEQRRTIQSDDEDYR